MRKIASILLACAMVLTMLLSVTAYAANTTKLNIAQIRQEEGNLYLYLTGVMIGVRPHWKHLHPGITR